MNHPKPAPSISPLHAADPRGPLWKTAGQWAGAIAVSSLVLLVVAALTPRRVHPSTESCAVTAYLTGDGFHANLTLPVHRSEFDWREHLDLQEIGQGEDKSYTHLSFGWGDRQFYLNTPRLQDLKLNHTLRAFFWPTDSVMHVQGHLSLPQAGDRYRVEAIRLSSSAYRQLATHVLSSFQQDAGQKPLPIQRSHRYSGTFYAGVGSYGIWQTCNDWIAAGLRQANVRTPLWSGLSASVFRQLQSNCLE